MTPEFAIKAYLEGMLNLNQMVPARAFVQKTQLLEVSYFSPNVILGKRIVNEATSMIAQSILNINLLLRINFFIIGGSVGLNPFFYNSIKNNLTKSITPVKIQKAKLKSKAELY